MIINCLGITVSRLDVLRKCMSHRNPPLKPVRIPGVTQNTARIRWAYAAIVCFMLPTASQATSQDDSRVFKSVDLVFEAWMLEAIGTYLLLDETQTASVTQSLKVYFDKITTLDAAVRQRVDDAGFRRFAELSEAARYRGVDPPWDEMNQLAIQFQREGVAGHHESDALLHEFYEQIQLILTPQQQELFERVPRLVRRLNAQRRRRGAVQADFSGSMDLFELVAEAAEDGEELQPIFDDDPEPDDADRLVKLADEINSILMIYEIEFDALRLEILKRRRTPRPATYQVKTTSQSDDGRDLRRRWMRYYTLTESAVAQIAAVAGRGTDANASEAWLDRFHQRLCPELYADRWPDRMMIWLVARDDATEEQIEITSLLETEYLAQRHQTRRAAIAAGIKAKRRHFSPGGTEPLQLKYSRRLLQLRQSIRRVTDRFRALLTPEQQADLDKEFVRIKRYGEVGLFGPNVSNAAIRKLTGEVLPEGVLLGPIDPKTGQRHPDYGKPLKDEDDDGQQSDEDGGR